MKIKTWIKYEDSYIPPRCRKLRYRPCEDYVDIALQEVRLKNLRLAFDDVSFHGKGKIYMFKGELWAQAEMRNHSAAKEYGFSTPLDELIYNHEHCSTYFRSHWDSEIGKETTRDTVIKKAQADIRAYLLVDGVLFERVSEPRYCIYTFGLGCNHGGTALAVDYRYNPNISKTRYFSALQGTEAVAEANQIAQTRGDTNDIGRFKADIIVYMPEQVKVKPQKQHGDGNPLLNTFDGITTAAPDTLTASLLCMSVKEEL